MKNTRLEDKLKFEAYSVRDRDSVIRAHGRLLHLETNCRPPFYISIPSDELEAMIRSRKQADNLNHRTKRRPCHRPKDPVAVG